MIGTQAAAQIIVDQWDNTGLTEPFTPGENTNLFWDRMPDNPDEAIMVLEVPGPAPEPTYGDDPAYRRPRVQIYTRAAARKRSRAGELAEHAYQALFATDTTTTEGTVMRSQPITEPHPVDRDPQERVSFVFTVDLWLATAAV